MSVNRKTITVDTDRIKRIYHVSDVHIRTLKRHAEYSLVFDRLYAKLREMGTENAVVAVTGDIAHAKTEMSPELIDMIADFLKGLAAIMPTIVIAGNHDQNLNNPDRSDVLAPIVRLIKDPNLIYLRESGAYRIADCTFVHMACKDNPATFLRAHDVPGKETKIALYHGPVDRSKTDVGYTVSNKDVTNEVFAGYDIGLLGDIHKPQSITVQHNVKYAGSLIQQNHGENLDGHGMLVWDVASRSADFVPIDNDYGYCTVDIKQGVVVAGKADAVPTNARMRIRVEDTEASALKTIIASLRRDYTIEELTINRVADIQLIRNEDVKKRVIGDVMDVPYQTELILDYITNAFSADPADIDRIAEINKVLNSQLPEEDVTRNVHWKPKMFEFSNMFSYGPDNTIDFTKTNGIVGLFAPNSSGKSSLLDALTFCIFDKSSRAFKAGDILNNKKKKFSCKLNFEIDGVDYFIERSASKLASGNVRVDVRFWYLDKTGTEVSLNGEQRRDTNAVIRSYVGNYDDFIMTSFSVQNNNTLFIDLPQRERKDILGKFIGIDVFDKLYTMANDTIREKNALLKDFKSQDYASRLVNAEQEVATCDVSIAAADVLKDDFTIRRATRNDTILDNVSRLKEIDTSITDKKALDAEQTKIQKDLGGAEVDTVNEQDRLATQRNSLLDYEAKLIGVDGEELRKNAKSFTDAKTKVGPLIGSTGTLMNRRMRENKTLERISNHKYDPECKFCVQHNHDVHEEKLVSERLVAYLTDTLYVEQARMQGYYDLIEKYENAVEVHDEYISTVKMVEGTRTNISALEFRISAHDSKIETYKTRLVTVEEKIERYHKNVDAIKGNAEINENIANLKAQLKSTEADLSGIEKTLRDLHTRKSIAETTIKNVHEAIQKAETLEGERRAYEYYMEAVKRDGVPYELIAKIIPKIEEEVNAILSQIVDYGLLIEVDGKNINTYIAYSEEDIWPLELCGGMEKFISALSLRVALGNVSNLPRPNFLAIDEGFGVMDAERLNSIYLLFEHLKTQYDFILVISHIEHMKDVVDTYIEVKKSKGYSKVEYV